MDELAVFNDEAHHIQAFGRLWACGVEVSFEKLGAEKRQRVRLPTYAFNHKPYFIEPGKAIVTETARVERLSSIEQWGYRPVWKQRLNAENEAAIAAGVFGAPYFIVDGEPFWGNDRRPQIERWLEKGPF